MSMTNPGNDELPTRRSCGSMDVHRRLLTTSESYRTARSELENATIQLESTASLATRDVARIPVVVHVVTPEGTTIPDAQISSQIEVLNHDFRAANPDLSTAPSVFRDLAADARVEFFLATTAPDGAPTSGITRTATTLKSFGTDDTVKFADSGGANAWPSERYLNIWVCPLRGGLLGYAQFPGGAPATDGVVVTHTAFGTTGTARAPFDLGRTTTHEIGHWLNLFHIWGDDGTGCHGSDEVDDTPNQGGPNTGTPSFPHLSCGNAPDGDLFMDYMDYVDDAAMVMFTAGQGARMAACLDSVRRPLWAEQPTPAEEDAPPVPGPDAGQISLGPPTVVTRDERIDVFVSGSDAAVYHKWYDGSSWLPSASGWLSLGVVGAADESTPAALAAAAASGDPAGTESGVRPDGAAAPSAASAG